MVSRRTALGLIGGVVPLSALPSAQSGPALSRVVPLDDPTIEVIENVWIPMADGARLAARYAVPGEQPAPYLGRLDGVEISGPPGRRTFSLIEGTIEPSGEAIAGTGTTYKEAYRLCRTIREDDPNSAEMEAEAITIYDRGDWKIRLRARSLGRSTPTEFVCAESFEAWDGEKQFFSKRWEKRIPRRLV